MLRALELENFKGIGERQRIEFAPVTLLFGKNSAGKSTILHALLYLHELLATGNPDVRHTKLGGASLDLGGFHRLIHKHDVQRAMRIRVEFGVTASLLQGVNAELASDYIDLSAVDDGIDALWLEFEIGLVDRPGFSGPCVRELFMGTMESPRDPVCRITHGLTMRRGEAVDVLMHLGNSLEIANAHVHYEFSDEEWRDDPGGLHSELDIASPWDELADASPVYGEDEHRRFKEHCEGRRQVERNLADAKAIVESLWSALDPPDGIEHEEGDPDVLRRLRKSELKAAQEQQRKAQNELDALQEHWKYFLRYAGQREEREVYPTNGYGLVLHMVSELSLSDTPLHCMRALRCVQLDQGEDAGELTPEVLAAAEGLIRMLTTNPLLLLEQYLAEIVHVGPLRCVPGRMELLNEGSSEMALREGEAWPGRVATARAGAASWLDGRAAWSALQGSTHLLAACNDWLARIGAGFTLHRYSLVGHTSRSDERHELSQLCLRTRSNQVVMPNEVGVGLAQLMPVIVACVQGGKGLCMFEQPELHIHPGIQVELADLFAETGESAGPRIIETHGEHIVLRFLRRIREAAEQPGPRPAVARKENLAVLYVQSGEKGTRIERQEIDDTGEFVEDWPEGFFEERGKELF